jgi:hypothetical protein
VLPSERDLNSAKKPGDQVPETQDGGGSQATIAWAQAIEYDW